MAKTSKINIVLSAVDKMTFVIDKAVNNGIAKFETMRKKADSIARSSASFAQNTGAMGLAAAAALAVPLRNAVEFEKSMANISTLIDTNTESMVKMNNDVLAIANKLPVKVSDLSAALYDVRSAGISAENAISTLDYAAKLSIAGLSTTSEATNIMTSAMNAFKSEGLEAAQIADILFKTVKAGKTDISKLSESFGANAGTIAAAGIKLQDFQAATAALTTVGQPASQAQNRLRAVIDSLNKPSSEMQKIFDAIGIKSTTELIEKAGGLGNAMKLVSSTSEDLNLNLSKALGSSEAFGAVISLNGAQNEAYTKTLALMSNGVSDLNGALEKQMATFASKQQILNNKLQVLSIKVGNVLLPIIIKLVDKISPIIDKIVAWVDANSKLTATIVSVTAGFSALMLALSAGGFIISGIASLFSAIGVIGPILVSGLGLIGKAFVSLWGLISSLAPLISGAFTLISSAIGTMTTFLLANPIIAIIAAIALAAYLIYDNWGAISAFFQTQWALVMVVFQNFMIWFDSFSLYDSGLAIIKGLWQGLMAGGNKVLNFASELGAEISNSFKSVLGIASPSKVFIEHGQNIAKGAQIGMMGANGGAQIGATAGAMVGAAPNAIPSGSGGGAMVLNYSPSINIAGATESQKQDFAQILKQNAEEIYRIFSDMKARESRLTF
jgi:TP901 family phage tail tape measure protein